jgi:hypothetical protein
MDETLPVGDDEYVYRRIHRAHLQLGVSLPLQVLSFRPSERDTTGGPLA